MSADDVDEAFVCWLLQHNRAGWVDGFRELRPTVLAWADADDLLAIFSALGECTTAPDDLAELFACMRVSDANES